MSGNVSGPPSSPSARLATSMLVIGAAFILLGIFLVFTRSEINQAQAAGLRILFAVGTGGLAGGFAGTFGLAGNVGILRITGSGGFVAFLITLFFNLNGSGPTPPNITPTPIIPCAGAPCPNTPTFTPAPTDSPVPPTFTLTPTPRSAPPPPTPVNVTLFPANTAHVTWDTSSNDVTSFDVYRSDDVNKVLANIPASNQPSYAYDDTNLPCGQTLNYLVTANNDVGKSFATVSPAITTIPCPPPTSTPTPLPDRLVITQILLQNHEDHPFCVDFSVNGQREGWSYQHEVRTGTILNIPADFVPNNKAAEFLGVGAQDQVTATFNFWNSPNSTIPINGKNCGSNGRYGWNQFTFTPGPKSDTRTFNISSPPDVGSGTLRVTLTWLILQR